MIEKIQLLVLTILISFANIAQQEKPTVLTIDKANYSIDEFNYIYTKNNKNISYKKKDLDNYMELFINYKLKVNEAYVLGYDTIPRLINELKQYREQLSQPYMIDKEKNEALIKEAYDRTKYELRASHILIGVKQSASPIDTLKAYNKVIALRDRIIKGEDFATVAKGKGGSEDPSAVSNGGDLGYFTALQMVYPFEDAAFKTKVGEVSMPVRTQFGYHIIKTVDKRLAKGKIETSHIMILTTKSMSEKEVAQTEVKINEIYSKLIEGAKFEDLAMKFSDDQSSKAKGGLLPAFGSGTKQRMVPVFEENAFSLAKDGDYSKPFLSPYGWHIVKRVKLSPIASYDDMYRELKLKVERDVRAQKTKQSFINNLKKEYNFNDNIFLLKGFSSIVSPNVTKGKWNKPESFENSNELLFSFATKKITLNDFANYINNTQRSEKPQTVSTYIDKKYHEFINKEIVMYEDSKLETKYPEFKTLMQEYQDGILIFEIMQNEIWNKASQDSVGLANHYNNNKSDFMYPTRYKGTLYTCQNKKIAKSVLKSLKEKKSTKDIKTELNKDSELNLKTKESTYNSKTTNEFKKGRKKNKIRTFKKGINKPFKSNGSYYIFDVEEVLQPTQREYKDAKGLVTAAYQSELQDRWLTKLRTKSKITINKTILYSAKKYK